MAWTVEIVAGSVGPHPQNPQMLKGVVRFTNGGESFDVPIHGTTIDLTWVKRWARVILANLNQRDAAAATLAGITAITPEDAPQPPADLVAARAAVQKLINMNQLKGATTGAAATAVTNRMATIQGVLTTYMQNNPGVNIEDLL